MKGLITIVREWRSRRSQKEWRNKLQMIHNTFQVEELNGILYLMCDGVPYKQIDSNASATEITVLLGESRNAMRVYQKSKNDVIVEEVEPA